MLRSMTGFGRGEAVGADVAVVVELRSVNNRYLDVQVRAPREYMAYEPEIQTTLKDGFKRGRLEAYVRRQPTRTRTVVHGDGELFRAYLGAIDNLVGAEGDAATRQAAVAWVLAQQGVLNVNTEDVDVMGEAEVLRAALEAAITGLREMREAEGRALYADLDKHLVRMLHEVDAIDVLSPDLHSRLKTRLESKVKKLLGERYEPWRVVQEAALLAEKADVSEEIARLKSHGVQFKEALERDEPIGRRLDFLLQEMNREINTIGSKAAEHPVSNRVVEMKSILERMREQAANVE
ncbi:MAG TPA: YicC family protein [Myxococcota bacterium]|nr:YicC family protein [Myxococcota bacterium]